MFAADEGQIDTMGRSPEENDALRLRPDMASFRLLVLAFVRNYIEAYGVSPSQGEIVNGLDSNRTRVRHALRSLEKSGLIIWARGERALSLPEVRDDAIRKLRELGWAVDEDIRFAGPISTVPATPELTYPEDPGAPLSQDGETNGNEADAHRKSA